MNRVHIINGPNLNLLGKRQPEIYGRVSFDDYLNKLRSKFPSRDIIYFQSNHEGELIDYVQKIGFDTVYIVFNPAAYTHTSIALADTLSAITAPVIEVHISKVSERESFRRHSYIQPHCVFSIEGRGLDGYEEAILWFLEKEIN